jgi:hypothetical protein
MDIWGEAQPILDRNNNEKSLSRYLWLLCKQQFNVRWPRQLLVLAEITV